MHEVVTRKNDGWTDGSNDENGVNSEEQKSKENICFLKHTNKK